MINLKVYYCLLLVGSIVSIWVGHIFPCYRKRKDLYSVSEIPFYPCWVLINYTVLSATRAPWMDEGVKSLSKILFSSSYY